MLSALIVSKPGLVEDAKYNNNAARWCPILKGNKTGWWDGLNKKIKDDYGESDNRGIRTLASKDWMGD